MGGLRSLASFVCILLGGLCVVFVPSASYTHDDVLDRDGFVRTVQPLSQNKEVQDVVIAAVVKQVMAHLDVSALASDNLPGLGSLLGSSIQDAAAVLVRQITAQVVHSSVFVTLWDTVARDTHPQVVYVLTGRKPVRTTVTVRSDGVVVMELAPVIEQVRKDLVSAGMVTAAAVPALGATIEVARLPHLGTTRVAARTLDAASGSLLLVGLVLVGLGVAVARSRWLAAAFAGAVVAVGSGVLLLAVDGARTAFVAEVGARDMSPSTAHFVFDTSVRHLHKGMTQALFASLVVLVVGASGSGYARSRPQPARTG